MVEQIGTCSELSKGDIPFLYGLYIVNISRASTFVLRSNSKWIYHTSLLCCTVCLMRNVCVWCSGVGTKKYARKSHSPSSNVDQHRETLNYALALLDR